MTKLLSRKALSKDGGLEAAAPWAVRGRSGAAKLGNIIDLDETYSCPAIRPGHNDRVGAG